MIPAAPGAVYISPNIAAVQALYRGLFTAEFRRLDIGEQIEQQARVLHAAHAAHNPAVLFQIQSWLPGAAHTPPEILLTQPFSLEQARTTLAREYGYADACSALELGLRPPDAAFESAVDTLLAGDLPFLTSQLDAQPTLATRASDFGHRATLLHYLGANGVETWRQVTPRNAASLAEWLIARGADVNAVARMYGGATPLGLVLTSDHPHKAGVTPALAQVLRAAGARENP